MLRGLYCPYFLSRGCPKGTLPLELQRAPSLVPAGAEKWLKMSATTVHPWMGSL